MPYESDEDLDEAMNELLSDIASDADTCHCFSESDARMEGPDRHTGDAHGLSRLVVPLFPGPLYEKSLSGWYVLRYMYHTRYMMTSTPPPSSPSSFTEPLPARSLSAPGW